MQGGYGCLSNRNAAAHLQRFSQVTCWRHKRLQQRSSWQVSRSSQAGQHSSNGVTASLVAPASSATAGSLPSPADSCAPPPNGSSSSTGAAGNGRPPATGYNQYGALEKKDYPKFVHFFRQASPYIEGHRGRTFVVVVPGEVVDEKDTLYQLLEDVALLHGLGVRLVVVLGARPQINTALREHGLEPQYAGGQRVTDAVAMQAAIQAAGAARMEVEARLSKGPAVQMVRRHARSTDQFHYAPALQTVSGNWVAAKRMGVVNGVDFMFTGVVRFVQTDAVRKQLESGNVVLLSNVGYSAAGEVLNCDIYNVAVRAAADLQADKLFCMTLPSLQPLDLPQWVPLSNAEQLLRDLAARNSGGGNGISASAAGAPFTPTPAFLAPGGASAATSSTDERDELDFEHWQAAGLPVPLIAACTACKLGVKRAHLVDATMDGGLLLELYSQDGCGTMISADFYEGIRPAAPADISAIEALLRPLEEKGVLLARGRDQLLGELGLFTVTEREAKVLGCAQVKPLGRGADGETVAELAAFCIHPAYRGAGRGDSLLEYLEAEARASGVTRMVLLTTRTADWFEQRGFRPAGPAHSCELLPEHRRVQVNPVRNSQLYVKMLNQPEAASLAAAAGAAGLRLPT